MSTIKCGKCRGTHGSVEEVRACYVEPVVEPVVEMVPGIYVTPEGKKYRVVRSESGHLYAEDIQRIEWFYRKRRHARRWVYVKGAINLLTPEMLRPDADYTTGRIPS